jgi:hypothetical protein
MKWYCQSINVELSLTLPIEQYRIRNLSNCFRFIVLKAYGFTDFLGTISVFEIRKKLPRKDWEEGVRNFDLVNIISKIDLYISSSKLQLRAFAYRHTIGLPTSCPMLLAQLGQVEVARPGSEIAAVQTRSSSQIRIKSKFDFNGMVYEVVEELPDGNIRATCLFGANEGEDLRFSREDVLSMVQQKRSR